jgi:hypothetical protein
MPGLTTPAGTQALFITGGGGFTKKHIAYLTY